MIEAEFLKPMNPQIEGPTDRLFCATEKEPGLYAIEATNH